MKKNDGDIMIHNYSTKFPAKFDVVTSWRKLLLPIIFLFFYIAKVTVALSLQKSPAFFSSSSSSSKSIRRGITRIPIAGRYENMTISSLGCGTWSWGNRLLYNYDANQDSELYDAYQTVRDAGVTVFDTADSYGTFNYNGRAEILLGQFERKYQTEKQGTKQQSSSSSWFNTSFGSFGSKVSKSSGTNINVRQVATKLAPYPWRVTRGSVVSAGKASLKRIEEEKVAIAQVHWSTANYQPFQERALWDGISDLYDLNLCDAIGVSNYGPKQLLKILHYLQEERNNIPLATAQIQYSLLTYKDPLTRDMQSVCSENGVRLISYSPLCLGLLSGKYSLDNINTNIPSIPRKQLFRELLPGCQNLLQTMEVMAKENNKSMSQIAINWTICKNTIPIPGCRTVQQAVETIDSAVSFRLTQSEMDELDKQALSISKPMIQNIFQTK